MRDVTKSLLILGAVFAAAAIYNNNGRLPFTNDGMEITVMKPDSYSTLFNKAVWQDGSPHISPGLAVCHLEGDGPHIVFTADNSEFLPAESGTVTVTANECLYKEASRGRVPLHFQRQ